MTSIRFLTAILFCTASIKSSAEAIPINDATLKPGFPIEMIKTYGSANSFSYIKVANVDQDPELEIILSEPYSKTTYVWNHDGSLKENWPINLSKQLNITIANVSSSSSGKAIIGTAEGSGFIGDDNEMYAIDPEGFVLNEFDNLSTTSGELFGLYTPLAIDVNSDGKDELIAAGRTKPTIRFGNGDTLESNIYSIEDRQRFFRYAGADMDNDGEIEIFGVGSNYTASDNFQNLFLFNSQMNVLPGWPKKVDASNYIYNPIIADINSDAQLEAILLKMNDEPIDENYSFLALDKEGNELKNIKLQSRGHVMSQPIVVDIDNNGSLEFIVMQRAPGTGDNREPNRLAVYDDNGKYYEGWPITFPKTLLNTCLKCGVAVGDVDGDDTADIVYLTEWIDPEGGFNEIQGFIIVVVDKNGREKLKQTVKSSSDRLSTGWIDRVQPVIADIDKDGFNEVLVYYMDPTYDQNDDGYFPFIWAYDFGNYGKQQNGPVLWGQVGGDEKNSHTVEPTPIGDYRSISFVPPEHITIPFLGETIVKVNFSDSNSSSKYTASVSTKTDTLELTHSLLENNQITVNIKGTPSIQGTGQVIVRIEDAVNSNNFQTTHIPVTVEKNLPPEVNHDNFEHTLGSTKSQFSVVANDRDPEMRLDLSSIVLDATWDDEVVPYENVNGSGNIKLLENGIIEFSRTKAEYEQTNVQETELYYTIKDLDGMSAPYKGTIRIKSNLPIPTPTAPDNKENNSGGGSTKSLTLFMLILVLHRIYAARS